MRFRGTVYRAHHPNWPFAPDSGEAAAFAGGRFNPVGMPALYTALRIETAWLEARQGFALKGEALRLCAYEVDSRDMLDLTDGAVGLLGGDGAADMARAWKDIATRRETPPTWEMARRLGAAGVAGILARSFATGAGAADVIAVFWQWSARPPHQVRLIEDFQPPPAPAAR